MERFGSVIVLVNSIFELLWLVVAFAVCFFTLSQRVATRIALYMSAALTAAFVVGATLPTRIIGDSKTDQPQPIAVAQATATPTSPTAVATSAATNMPNVASICHAAKKPTGEGTGNVDAAWVSRDGEPTVVLADRALIVRAGRLRFAGWAASKNGTAEAAAACITIDGRIVPSQNATYGGDRPDVVAYLKHRDTLHSAFDDEVDIRSLPPGPHVVRIASVNSGGASSFVSGKRLFTVVESGRN